MVKRGLLATRKALVVAALATWVVSSTSLAEEVEKTEDDWGEDDWGEEADDVGFAEVAPQEETERSAEDEETETKTKTKTKNEAAEEVYKAPSPLSITGFVRSDWALWVERFASNPWAKGRQSLDLEGSYKTPLWRVVLAGHAEYDFAYLNDRESYDEPTLEAYEWQLALRESYAAVTTSHVDITAGWQIVPWGVGELVSKVDITTPKDIREPGLSDLEDMRLPVLSTRVGFFFGYHRLEAMMVHESFFGYMSPPFGPFSPLAGAIPEDAKELMVNTDARYHHLPDRFDIRAQQFFFRWSYTGPGIDLSVYAASALDQTGVYLLDFGEMLNDIYESNPVEIDVEHPRYAMIGHSGAWPVSDWIFKWELVADFDRCYSVGDLEATIPVIDKERANSLGGLVTVNYQGIENTMMWVEFAKSWLLEDIPGELFRSEEPTIGIAFRQMALRDDLTIELNGMILGWSADFGWLGRVQASYIIIDGVDVGLGYIHYDPGTKLGIFSGFDTHDRVYLKFRWDFTIY